MIARVPAGYPVHEIPASEPWGNLYHQAITFVVTETQGRTLLGFAPIRARWPPCPFLPLDPMLFPLSHNHPIARFLGIGVAHRRAEEGLTRIRHAQHALVAGQLSERLGIDIRITDITWATLNAIEVQWCPAFTDSPSHVHASWDWRYLAGRNRNRPTRFEAAIWAGDQLCALGIGRIAKQGRTTVSVTHIGGAPTPHPLKGMALEAMLLTAYACGKALGARHLLAMEPLPTVLHLYQRMGFRLEFRGQRVLYCHTRIL